MMKKALIYSLSLALLLSLTACHKAQADQPSEPDPAQTTTSEPVQELTTDTEPPEQTPITPEPLSDKTPATPDATEANQPPEETESQDVEEIKLFEDCNETVYATGTVNIRESYTADSTKLGSLSAGQSVTRTGVAIAGTEAEGWSRVQLSNGTTAYISSKYLSTTKPVQQQQSTQSQGNQQTQQTQSDGSQQTQQSTSSTQYDGHDDLGDYVLNGKGGKYYPALGITVPVSYDGTTTNGAPPQTAEEQEQAKKTQEAALESADWHTNSWQGVNMGG